LDGAIVENLDSDSTPSPRDRDNHGKNSNSVSTPSREDGCNHGTDPEFDAERTTAPVTDPTNHSGGTTSSVWWLETVDNNLYNAIRSDLPMQGHYTQFGHRLCAQDAQGETLCGRVRAAGSMVGSRV
jgi:hypothetical protein